MNTELIKQHSILSYPKGSKGTVYLCRQAPAQYYVAMISHNGKDSSCTSITSYGQAQRDYARSVLEPCVSGS